jgi:hypothetical protein
VQTEFTYLYKRQKKNNSFSFVRFVRSGLSQPTTSQRNSDKKNNQIIINRSEMEHKKIKIIGIFEFVKSKWNKRQFKIINKNGGTRKALIE